MCNAESRVQERLVQEPVRKLFMTMDFHRALQSSNLTMAPWQPTSWLSDCQNRRKRSFSVTPSQSYVIGDMVGLRRILSSDEIEDVLKGMGLTKAPGPDIFFYSVGDDTKLPHIRCLQGRS